MFAELVHPNNESFQIWAHLDTEIIEAAVMVIAARLIGLCWCLESIS